MSTNVRLYLQDDAKIYFSRVKRDGIKRVNQYDFRVGCPKKKDTESVSNQRPWGYVKDDEHENDVFRGLDPDRRHCEP